MKPAFKACLVAALALLPAGPTLAVPAVPTPEVRLPHISIVTIGTGSPVILIPGLASPRAVWDGVAPALAAKHRVILVQVNGFGGDDPGANLQPGVLDGIVADLDGYIAAEKLQNALVVGHSMGGLVGLMLAKAHPSDLSRLMIVDSLPFFAVIMAPPGVDPTPAMVAPYAAKMRDGIVATYGKPLSDEMVAAQTRGLALKPSSVVTMSAWAKAADPRVTGEAMYEDLTTDLRPSLATIATPITMLYPWNAASLPKAKADAFYRKQYAAAPHIAFVDIAESAHMVMLDQPEAFKAAVVAFVEAK
ncbi:alpha/beta fold hydrolase [Sphingomonas glacialis]|uniref:alpha/beta fold hydrolase n=1 Tax=Sphingomonas glacialis TaxID=658225 RepID=UPI001F4FECE1|nr:alpha/beta hydrolase [Sphingomonas glacialis]